MKCNYCAKETLSRTGFCSQECTKEFRAAERKFYYDLSAQQRKDARTSKEQRKKVNK